MKKKTFALLLSLIFSIALFADNKNSNDKNSENTVDVSGKIVDKITGETLPGVKVKIENTCFEAYTDFEGNFNFSSIVKGEYDITVDYIAYSSIVLDDYNLEETKEEIIIELEEK